MTIDDLIKKREKEYRDKALIKQTKSAYALQFVIDLKQYKKDQAK